MVLIVAIHAFYLENVLGEAPTGPDRGSAVPLAQC
jgi:hypothetical protein